MPVGFGGCGEGQGNEDQGDGGGKEEEAHYVEGVPEGFEAAEEGLTFPWGGGEEVELGCFSHVEE